MDHPKSDNILHLILKHFKSPAYMFGNRNPEHFHRPDRQFAQHRSEHLLRFFFHADFLRYFPKPQQHI
ncbi:hypothetical protein ABEO63_14775 [Geobacillus stearothermophilus]|nr:hypothetical protein [Geobacillus zalihae]